MPFRLFLRYRDLEVAGEGLHRRRLPHAASVPGRDDPEPVAFVSERIQQPGYAVDYTDIRFVALPIISSHSRTVSGISSSGKPSLLSPETPGIPSTTLRSSGFLSIPRFSSSSESEFIITDSVSISVPSTSKMMSVYFFFPFFRSDVPVLM